MIPFIDLQAQRQRIQNEIDAAVTRVIHSGQYMMGNDVTALEEELSAFCGARHAITCANGTDALVLALRALDISTGDVVFAPSFTFVATVEAVRLVGAVPAFVDVDAATFNICPQSLAETINHVKRTTDLRPRAIIPVDLFGQPADYDAIQQVAMKHSLDIIADSAQSFGASLGGTPVGRLGRITTTSFFPAKPLGCYGDGGAMFTEDDDLAALLRSLRNHGQGTDRYDNVRVGLNSRLDTLQAAILREKLKIFPSEIEARERIAQAYSSGLPNGLRAQAVRAGAQSVWAQYTVVCQNGDRDKMREDLAARQIPTAVYYPKPNHLQAPYLSAPRAPRGLPVTTELQSKVFSLPMHPYLDQKTQGDILEALADING